MSSKTPAMLLSLLLLPLLCVAAESDDEKTGKQLYFDHACYACHGYQGIGRHNLANGVSGIMLSEQVFLIYLRARGDAQPGNPVQSMPSYPANALSDADALKIYEYIKTFQDDPPDVDEIPALRGILDDLDAPDDEPD